MKKTLLWLLLGPLALVLTLAVAVNVMAWSGDSGAPPDPATVIVLPDGERRPLGELVEAWGGPTASEEPPSTSAAPVTAAEAPRRDAPRAELDVAAVLERVRREREDFRRNGPPEGDLFGLAEWHRGQGSHEQAAALYASVPRGHRQYALAQRRLAWDCYTLGQDEPIRGVAHAHASLSADPLSGNAWQDAARVYAATLGLDVD